MMDDDTFAELDPLGTEIQEYPTVYGRDDDNTPPWNRMGARGLDDDDDDDERTHEDFFFEPLSVEPLSVEPWSVEPLSGEALLGGAVGEALGGGALGGAVTLGGAVGGGAVALGGGALGGALGGGAAMLFNDIFPGKDTSRKLQPLVRARLTEKASQGRKGEQPLASLKQIEKMLTGTAANHRLAQFMLMDYRPYTLEELQEAWNNIKSGAKAAKKKDYLRPTHLRKCEGVDLGDGTGFYSEGSVCFGQAFPMCWVYRYDVSGKPTHYVMCDYFYQACDPEGVNTLEDRIRNEVFGVPSGLFTEMVTPSAWYSLKEVDVDRFKQLYPNVPLVTLRPWSPALILVIPRGPMPKWIEEGLAPEQQLALVEAVISGIRTAGRIGEQAMLNMLGNPTIKLDADPIRARGLWVEAQQWLYDGYSGDEPIVA
jgi:hypothetical protein